MKTRSYLLAVALVAAFSLGLSAITQQPMYTVPNGCVAIQDGDNLWTYRHDFEIKDLAQKNPGLNPPLDSRIRQFTSSHGQPGILIRRDRDKFICGVTREGNALIPTSAATTNATAPATGNNGPTGTTGGKGNSNALAGLKWLVWLAIIVIAMIIVLVALRWWFRHRDPAGAPERRFVREGVQPEQARAYTTNTLAPQMYPGRPFIILSQTRQRARGAVISHYVNPPRQETVVLDGGPNSYVYRTQLRFTDTGEETEMPFLQACGNPIRYGTIARYMQGLNFEYLGEPEIIPAPTPAPAEPVAEPVATVVAPRPTRLLTGIELSEADGSSFRMSRIGESVMIELAGTNGAQFMMAIPKGALRYDGNAFTVASDDLPHGMFIPVPPEIIAAAAVRQLTAPTETEEPAAIELSSAAKA